jgi:transposase
MGMHYTNEFRDEAVRFVLESKMSVSQVAKDLGVNVWTLREWVQKHRQRERSGQPARAESLEQENYRLKRELAMLKQERDILKKAAAYFAKEQL